MKAIKISATDIRKKRPCYDPTEIEGITDKTSMTLMEWMSVKGYKNGDADKVWLFSCFADDLINRKFAIWCARRCKTTIPEIEACISAIEGYYLLGTHTKEQMDAADRAAYRAAYRTANWAADWAADWAAYWAADRAADWAADRAAYRTANRAADWAAYWAADRAADWAADRAAYRTANRTADRAADWAAYWAAYRTANRTADRAADWAADRAADWAADRAAYRTANRTADWADERRVQVREIKRMLKESGK